MSTIPIEVPEEATIGALKNAAEKKTCCQGILKFENKKFRNDDQILARDVGIGPMTTVVFRTSSEKNQDGRQSRDGRQSSEKNSAWIEGRGTYLHQRGNQEKNSSERAEIESESDHDNQTQDQQERNKSEK